ncbi:hypothetical protein L209DRAFT_239249 [Thermothelomyces heterothallicus CBS 203.75]
MGWDGNWQYLLTTLSHATPAECCQAVFLLSAAGVLAVAVLPHDAKTLLVDYGARKARKPSADGRPQEVPNRGWLLSLIDTVTCWSQVPHSWFSSFYVVSLACSVFWLVQYLRDGAVLRCVADSQAAASERSATLGQVALGWFMMFLQSTRREFEHWTIMKPSKSTMWVVHWLLGFLFYFTINLSVWVEGSHAILNPAGHADDAQSLLKMAAATPVFLFAWINQYWCHKHLAELKKYSLPTAGMFRHYICPHYTCECLLYLSIAIATAPRGVWLNRTMVCALLFVATNLGVTAAGTRKWYGETFGIGSVANKWNMIPFIF